MLSLETIIKISQDPGSALREDTFSPDWHAKNPAPQEGGVLGNRISGESAETVRSVKVILGYALNRATGDVHLRQYASEAERDADPDKSL